MKLLAKSIILVIQILGSFTLLAISACHRDCDFTEEVEPNLPCKVAGACDVTINQYIYQLNKHGIKVITMGQAYLISIPACFLFENETPNLTYSAPDLLCEITMFLKQFRKIQINVISYSGKYVSMQRDLALTLARSRVVGEYLWSHGVDSRFIFTHGLGSDKPIFGSVVGGDKSPNARIEITFRRAVA